MPEWLAMLMPPSVFYRRRIAQEARTGEPELAVLAELVPRGGIAVDVGANVGFFAYALADIADRVLAFEPNPDYAFFARWMLRDRAEVHEVALSDASGRGTLYVPLSDQGVLLHLAGSFQGVVEGEENAAALSLRASGGTDVPWRPHWLAGHVRLELTNVVAKYPFERSHRFAGIQPNSGR
jgi:hypothetical protein